METIYGDLVSMWEDLMEEMFTDVRLYAVKASERVTYTVRYAIEESIADVVVEYEDLEFTHWDERLECEPEWTDGEEAESAVHEATYIAVQGSDARQAWNNIRLTNTL